MKFRPGPKQGAGLLTDRGAEPPRRLQPVEAQ